MKAGQIVAALEARDWKQHQIAERLATSQPNVSRWKSKGSEPTGELRDRLHALAREQGIIVEPKQPRQDSPNRKPQLIPVLSWISAGRLSGSDMPANVKAEKRIAVADLKQSKWIALRVSGESMNRVAPDGSMIFVDLADKRLVEEGFYVFAQPTGDATFKRYRGGRRPRLQPYSTDPDQETIPAPEDLEVIGRVRRVVNDLP